MKWDASLCKTLSWGWPGRRIPSLTRTLFVTAFVFRNGMYLVQVILFETGVRRLPWPLSCIEMHSFLFCHIQFWFICTWIVSQLRASQLSLYLISIRLRCIRSSLDIRSVVLHCSLPCSIPSRNFWTPCLPLRPHSTIPLRMTEFLHAQ